MGNKRFVIKSTATELELYDGDVQIGEFPHFEWVAKSVDSVVDLLNEFEAKCHKLEKENEQLGDDLNCLLRLIEDTPIEHSLYVQKIKERWEND